MGTASFFIFFVLSENWNDQASEKNKKDIVDSRFPAPNYN